MSLKHQERRRRALERLEARIERCESGPTKKQLIERTALREALGL